MTGGPQLMTQLGPKGSGYPSVPKAPEEARQAEMPGRNTTNPVFPIYINILFRWSPFLV